jgi:hypothetical protein
MKNRLRAVFHMLSFLLVVYFLHFLKFTSGFALILALALVTLQFAGSGV